MGNGISKKKDLMTEEITENHGTSEVTNQHFIKRKELKWLIP